MDKDEQTPPVEQKIDTAENQEEQKEEKSARPEYTGDKGYFEA